MIDRRWPNETFLWGDKSLGISIYAERDWGSGTKYTAYAWADGKKRSTRLSNRKREVVERISALDHAPPGYEQRIREWVSESYA